MVLISIHLMLLFIAKTKENRNVVIRFQYISCYCLSLFFAPFMYLLHSFQYISCYCLSLSVSILAFVCGNFNTSHVTVYRAGVKGISNNSIFQYISCYCLSYTDEEEIKTKHWFQYISCYCLSKGVILVFGSKMISIHLMLLFIFTPS